MVAGESQRGIHRHVGFQIETLPKIAMSAEPAKKARFVTPLELDVFLVVCAILRGWYVTWLFRGPQLILWFAFLYPFLFGLSLISKRYRTRILFTSAIVLWLLGELSRATIAT